MEYKGNCFSNTVLVWVSLKDVCTCSATLLSMQIHMEVFNDSYFGNNFKQREGGRQADGERGRDVSTKYFFDFLKDDAITFVQHLNSMYWV